jgi:hypothetical protein
MVEQVLLGSGGRSGTGGRGEVVQTVYTYVNKCKNDKRKENICDLPLFMEIGRGAML